jgi:hypothetical protein
MVMKDFKKYTVSELKLIAKSFNEHIKIDYEKMKKPELIKALEMHLEHDAKGEVVMKPKTHKIMIVESNAEKYVKTNPDSSIKVFINQLARFYHKKYDKAKADLKASREVEKLYEKYKGRKDVAKINELIISDIEDIMSEEPKEKKEKKPVGRPKKKKD